MISNAKRGLALALSLVLAFVMVLPMLSRPLYVPASAATTEELKQKIANLDEQIAASEEKIAENNKNKKEAQSSADSIQSEVDALQTQISAYNSKIDALNEQISSLNDDINSTQKDISETEKKLAKQKESIGDTQKLLGERLSAMYKTGNVTNLEILLEADSFASFLNRLELITRISKHDSDIIATLQEQSAELQSTKDTLESQQSSLQASKQEIQSAKSEQQDAKSQIVSKKSTLDTKVNTLNGYIEELDADSAELESYVAAARAQQQAYMNSINAQLAVTASTGTGTYVTPEGGNGTFVWPVPSSHNVSSGYGYRSGVGVSNFHYGIDITGAHGAEIVAAAAGTVSISANPCPHDYPKNYNCGCSGGYGNYVVIDHGNGLLTYYGHMASTACSVGQYVAQGQVIGYLGCSGYSTGNHCHFEVRVNSSGDRSLTARNPYNYF
ncbi:MAG: peptidoglycan DD-metalloendopeptidase family protein [Clostridia bacterium]|nr:peptidoglycan DD-metalloendopeptidase family protein [Clostridia bacterium]